MATIKVCDTEETLVTVEEYSLSKAIDRLKKETIAVIGYGVQGAAQALNLRDNGLSVVVGQRSGTLSWDKAVSDGWEPGVNLFSIEQACQRSSFIAFLLSDAGQVQQWPIVKANLSEAELVGVNLIEADLSQTNLRNADLSGADLWGAILIGADLRGAKLNGTVLDFTDLEQVKFCNTSMSDGSIRNDDC